MTSPFLYPLYGLGELPQSFARLAAVHGGTYMLNRGADDGPVFGEGKFDLVMGADGAACGVKVMDTVANAKVVVADPSYFPSMCTKKGTVVRAIAILSEPVASTNEAGSYQVIFPGASIGRQNDLYLFCCSAPHKVAPKDKYVVFVSTNVEGPTDGMTPEVVAQRELSQGLTMLTGVVRIFYDMYDLMVPNEDGTKDKCFLTESFDPTTHFETAITDVLAVYERITGALPSARGCANSAPPSPPCPRPPTARRPVSLRRLPPQSVRRLLTTRCRHPCCLRQVLPSC